MQEAMLVHRNLARFPILAFSNEPVSHLANQDVRSALDNARVPILASMNTQSCSNKLIS